MPRRLQQKKRETLPNKLFLKNNASADDKIIKQVTSLTLDFLKKKRRIPTNLISMFHRIDSCYLSFTFPFFIWYIYIYMYECVCKYIYACVITVMGGIITLYVGFFKLLPLPCVPGVNHARSERSKLTGDNSNYRRQKKTNDRGKISIGK